MNLDQKNPHEFIIPVMGTGFTVDTPARIARYGVSSVISLVDDVLLEQMREMYCEKEGVPFEPIPASDEDPRARRITAYLNQMHSIVSRQVDALQSSPFEEGSEITRYYEMLPESPLKAQYTEMLECEDPARKESLIKALRQSAVPGTIDVNIMTKLDCVNFRKGEQRPAQYNDAMASLRGFALSDLRASMVFSAGLSPTLYGYVAEFPDFFPDEHGNIKKRITLKVSDFRSAFIQGKFFAKRGLWISEFRIESGLNCGGHVFASKGDLMGPIMEKFRDERDDMLSTLRGTYLKALAAMDKSEPAALPDFLVTVQGGVATASEHSSMLDYFRADQVGWATPFLLVPEVTNVDDKHLELLEEAGEEEVFLSDASPVGVQFWNLWTSGSETARRRRIEEGAPGSACPKGLLRFNSEFTERAICRASRLYQKLKLEWLEKQDLPKETSDAIQHDVLSKSCICHDLAGGATIKHGIDPDAEPAICPSKSIVFFSKIASLEEMVDHIYGRVALFTNSERPHMFIRELKLYIDHLRKELESFSKGVLDRKPSYFSEFKENLLGGIKYYRECALQFVHEHQDRFLEDLTALCEQLEQIPVEQPSAG